VLRYKDLFRAANHLPKGTVAIVANADVLFDASLRHHHHHHHHHLRREANGPRASNTSRKHQP